MSWSRSRVVEAQHNLGLANAAECRIFRRKESTKKVSAELDWPFRRRGRFLLMMFLLALSLRVAFSFLLFPRLQGSLNLGSDPDLFGQLAMNWVDGRGFEFYTGASTHRGPGYPSMLAAIYLIFGDLFPASIVAQCIIGALTCLALFFLASRLFDERLAGLAALACAVHPLLIWYTPRLRYEYFLGLVLLLAILWTVRFQQSARRRDALVMGLFFGYGALTNQIVLTLPLVLFPVVLFGMRDRKRVLGLMAIAIIVMMAMVLPWTIRNYLVSGYVIPVHSGGVAQFIKGNWVEDHYSEAPMESDWLDIMSDKYIVDLLGEGVPASQSNIRAMGLDQKLIPYAVDYLANQPDRFIKKVLVQIPRFWFLSETRGKSMAFAAIQFPLIILALIGAWFSLRRNTGARVLLATILYFNLVYAAIYVEGRYSTPVMPYMILFATLGVLVLADRLARWKTPVMAPRSEVIARDSGDSLY